jgi:hypothetical protein
MKPATEHETPKFNEENSSVRRRSEAARPSSPELEGMSRESRIEYKLIEAEGLLNSLPSTDSRRRLLSAAVMRGDEALLDAILSTLNSER